MLAYTWNDAGHLATAAAGDWLWEYGRDDAGTSSRCAHRSESSPSWNADGLPTSIAYGEDVDRFDWVDGRLTAVTSTAANGDVTSTAYSYDDGRLATVDTDNGSISYGYDASGQVVSIERGEQRADVSYGADGPTALCVADRCERWRYRDGAAASIDAADGERYEVSFGAPGLLTEIAHDGEVLASAEIDQFARTTRVESDGRTAAFTWDDGGLRDAEIDGETVSVERSPLGLVSAITTADESYRGGVDGASFVGATVGDSEVAFRVDDPETGDEVPTVVGTLIDGAGGEDDPGGDGAASTVNWERDRLVTAVTSEGFAQFEYDDAGRVIDIAYDERIGDDFCPVTYGPGPSAEGTGRSSSTTCSTLAVGRCSEGSDRTAARAFRCWKDSPRRSDSTCRSHGRRIASPPRRSNWRSPRCPTSWSGKRRFREGQ